MKRIIINTLMIAFCMFQLCFAASDVLCKGSTIINGSSADSVKVKSTKLKYPFMYDSTWSAGNGKFSISSMLYSFPTDTYYIHFDSSIYHQDTMIQHIQGFTNNLNDVLLRKVGVSQRKNDIIMWNPSLYIKISKVHKGVIESLTVRTMNNVFSDTIHPIQFVLRDSISGDQYYQKNSDSVLSFSLGNDINHDTAFVQFKIKMPNDDTAIVRYKMELQTMLWTVKIKKVAPTSPRGVSIDFLIPVTQQMEYVFWTDDQAPFALEQDVVQRDVRYRGSQNLLPAMVMYNSTYDFGLSFVSPFDLKKPGLVHRFNLNQPNDPFRICNCYLKLAQNTPAQAAVYFVPHEGDWRPALAWMLNKYPAYFDSVNATVLNGEGWYCQGLPRTPLADMQDAAARGATWEEFHEHFPFYGLYAPMDRTVWKKLIDRDDFSYDAWKSFSIPNPGVDSNSYDSSNVKIQQWHDNNVQTYIYFQSSEAWYRYAKSGDVDSLWRARDEYNNLISAWKFCNLMNPDTAGGWGKHVMTGINYLLAHDSLVDGIFYDRDDYCNYDYQHHDGVTMIHNDTVSMLAFAQEKINKAISDTLHQHSKGIWTNGPSCVEVCKGMDGIMSEGIDLAGNQQYYGLARPMILLSYDSLPQETETKLTTALTHGYLPAITIGGSTCRNLDRKYRSVFALLKNKHWVLNAHALTSATDYKGNIFQAPDSDYIVSQIDFQKSQGFGDPFYSDINTSVCLNDASQIHYAYLLSGDYTSPSKIEYLTMGNTITVTIPSQMVSSLIRLTKNPRYEFTRLNRPFFVRGDSGKFQVKVHNINGRNHYDLTMSTPFNNKNYDFTLDSLAERTIDIDFLVPGNYPIGEDTNFQITCPPSLVEKYQFSAWIKDFVEFQLPQNLFLKLVNSATADTFHSFIVNNTPNAIQVTTQGQFTQGSGIVTIKEMGGTDTIDLYGYDKKECIVTITPYSDQGQIAIKAKMTGTTDSAMTYRPVERAMVSGAGDLFSDNFNNGSMKRSWTKSGTWAAEDSSVYGDSVSYFAWVDSSSWNNYKFQANTKLENSRSPSIWWLKSYIFCRIQDSTHYYRFGIHGDGKIIDLYRRAGTSWVQLSFSRYVPVKNTWYNLRIEVNGDSLLGYINGQRIIAVNDTTSTHYTHGGIGIGVLEDNMKTWFDDIVVRPIGP